MKVKILRKNGVQTVDLNRKKAIRERCLNCSGWNAAEVELCRQTGCALYPYRMNGTNQNAKKRNKAIRKYCLACCNGIPSEVKNCPALDCPLYAFRKAGCDHSIEIKSENCRGPIGVYSQAVLF